MSLTDAIRNALTELGPDASREEVEAHLKAAGVRTTSAFRSLLSQEKAKAKEAARENRRNNPEPIPLDTLRELAELVGADEDFAASLDRIERAVKLAGGFAQLRELASLFNKKAPRN